MESKQTGKGGREMEDMLSDIKSGMEPFDCVVSQREGYIRVWNCYSGAVMVSYNRKLDEVCASLSLKWCRKRTYGDGRINVADWEDQLRPT
jgi:hypothetical protein